MQLLKSRWPFAVLFISAMGYLSQYYRIEGLNHLRLKPLSRVAQSAPVGSPSSGLAVPFPTGDHLVSRGNFNPEPATHDLLKPLAPLPSSAGSNIADSSTLTSSVQAPPIHVGSFHMQLLNRPTLMGSKARETAAMVCSRFDVLAIQGISTREQDVLPQFIALMNQSGKAFDYMIGPRVGPADAQEQFAFIFDTARIETDRYQLYSVDDPQDLLVREPLVAWFRVKNLAPEVAFTFSVINVHLDESSAIDEATLIPELTKSVLADGRQEDDIFIAGVFNASARQMDFLRSAGLLMAFEEIATTVRGDRMLDNIVFSAAGTVEYMGRSGTMDILREFNLSISESEEISTHLPIWAEFSAVEGNQIGRVAPLQ